MKKSNIILWVRVCDEYFTRTLQEKYKNAAKALKQKCSPFD